MLCGGSGDGAGHMVGVLAGATTTAEVWIAVGLTVPKLRPDDPVLDVAPPAHLKGNFAGQPLDFGDAVWEVLGVGVVAPVAAVFGADMRRGVSKGNVGQDPVDRRTAI